MLTISGPAAVNEGLYTLNLSAADTFDDPITGWTISWGDGTRQTVFGNPNTISHVFAGTATETISATAADSQGTFAANSLVVQVTALPPTILSVSTVEPFAAEGSPVTLKVLATDVGGEALTYSFDFNNDSVYEVSNATGLAQYTFPVAGTYPVNVQVSNAFGESTTATYDLVVDVVPPTLALTSTPAMPTVNVGAPFQLNLSFTDPGNEPVESYSVNWGDGSIQTYNVATEGLQPTHIYQFGDTTYNVTVFNVTDSEGTFGVLGSLNVTVNDVSPTIALAGASQVVEGLPYTLTLGAVSDPGPDIITGYTVSWGDGSSDTFTGPPTVGGTVQHTYATTGPATIQVSLVDHDGTHTGAGQLGLSVLADTAPTANAGGYYTVVEGGSVQLDATQSSDPDQPASTLTYAWDFQGNGLFTDATGATPTYTANGMAGPGPVTVYVRVTDTQGLSSITSAVINIADVAPTATFSNNGPVNAGSPATVAFTNPSDLSNAETAAGFRYSYALSETALASTYAAAATATSSDFTFDDSGSDIVWGRIFDSAGSYTDYSTHVTVNDVAPTATFNNNGPINAASSAIVSFSNAMDPSTADMAASFHYSFALNEASLTADYASSGSASSASFSFDASGTYTVWGRIIDKNGGYTDYSTPVTVNDVAPTATFSNNGPVQAGGTRATVSFSNPFDPSNADTAAGFLYSYDFGNTGTFQIANSTATTVNVPSAFLVDGPANLVVRGRISDTNGGYTDYLTTITIEGVPPTAVFTNSGPITEGGSGTVSFSNQSDASPAEQAAGFSYSYDFGNTGTFQIANNGTATAAIPAQFLAYGPASLVVRGRITDAHGDYTDYLTAVIVNDIPPTATLAAPAAVNAASSFTVQLINPTDADTADTAAGFHYAFAVDGASLSGATYANSGSNPAQTFSFDPGPSVHTVTERIFDFKGTFTDYTATITVHDVPPTGTLVAPTSVYSGSPFTVQLVNAFDPSQVDTQAGFRYAFGVDGASLAGATYGNSASNPAQTFAFSDGPSVHTITERIFDVEGGYTDYTASVTVNASALPTVTVSDSGGTYNGTPFAATGAVTGLMGVNLGTPTFTYYAGTYGTVAALMNAIQQGIAIPLTGAPSNAGSYTVLASYAGGPGYTTGGALTTFTIGQAPLTVNVGSVNQTYGQAANLAAVLGNTIATGVHGEFLAVSYTSSGDATGAGVGGYPIYATLSNGTGNLANYSATINPGTLTVNRAVLVVTAASAARVYGAPNPTFTDTIAGFVNHDSPNVVSGTASFSTLASAGSAPGSYAITVAQGTLSAANYIFQFVPGTLTITKDATATDIAAAVNGQTVSLLAMVTAAAPGSGTPTGTVDFFDVTDNTDLGSAPLVGGNARFSTAWLPLGSQTIAATYGGDVDFSGSSNSLMESSAASVYVLNSSAAGALTLSGNADIIVPGAVEVDSSSLAATLRSTPPRSRWSARCSRAATSTSARHRSRALLRLPIPSRHCRFPAAVCRSRQRLTWPAIVRSPSIRAFTARLTCRAMPS
jgi:hypothetical protein